MEIKKLFHLCSGVPIALPPTTGTGGAHAIVTHTSMDERPLAPNRSVEIELHFNSTIEFNFVRIFLLNEQGDETRLASKAGTTKSAILVQMPLLKPGAYALRYRVLAVDGHFTDNLLRFSVSKPE